MKKPTEEEIAAEIERQRRAIEEAEQEYQQKQGQLVGFPGPDGEWEPPIPFENVNVPPFPVDCLPPDLKAYVVAVSESTQTPVDMAGVAALAVMAVCVQGKYKIQGKPDWIEPLNLYSLVVALPAERKSAVQALMTKYIDEYEASTNEFRMPDVNRNRAERKLLEKELDRLMNDAARDKASKADVLLKQDELTRFEDLRPLRLLADDASPEALTSLLAMNNGKMSVISAEGGFFEILAGRYSQTANIDTILKAHCGDTIRVDRKGRDSELIKEPCLTALLMIQPQVLDGIMENDVFRGRGLIARFLYSIPVSTVGNRAFETKAITYGVSEQYRELCFSLLNMKPDNGVEILTLSSEAYALSADFARQLEPRLIDDLDSMADFAGKLHGAVLRIAGIIHLVNQTVFAAGTPVPVETMQAAIALGYYFLEHARAAYQLMGADEQQQNAKYILSKLEKQRFDKVTKRDLLRLCRKFKKAEQLDNPINVLVEYNYFKATEQPYSGMGRQPEPLYSINPLWLNQRDKCD